MTEAQLAKVDKSLLLRITDAVPALIALYNIETGEYIYVNQAIRQLLGYKPDDFTEGGLRFVISLVHPDDHDRIMSQNQRALELANRQPIDSDEPIVSFEYRIKHHNGDWRWIRTDGTVFGRDSRGQVELLLNVSLDITDRKNAEQKLARSLKILEGVLKPDL